MAIGFKVVKGSATKARARRHFRLRKRVSGTALRPRLVVSRSARHLFVQVVDDTTSTTLASASTMEKELRTFAGDKTAKAKQVGHRLFSIAQPLSDASRNSFLERLPYPSQDHQKYDTFCPRTNRHARRTMARKRRAS